VPATVILLALGALIGAAGIPFWQVWLGAMLGAAIGDTVSYFIGRHFKDSAYRVWPLSKHPQLVERGERLFSRWGSVGVFVGARSSARLAQWCRSSRHLRDAPRALPGGEFFLRFRVGRGGARARARGSCTTGRSEEPRFPAGRYP
jgi:hypothetical protein